MSRWLLVAAAVLPALGAPPAHAARPHSPAGSAGRWTVQALPSGRSFSEPGAAAGRHGVLFASACTANANRPATFWRSPDAGRRWAQVSVGPSASTACGDADTAIGSDGYEYAALLASGVEVYRSRHGAVWHGPATFPLPHGADQPDRPWIVTVPGRPRTVHVFNSEVSGNVVEWTSHDHAATFTGPTLVTGGLNSQAALTLASRPLVDPRDPSRMAVFYETAGLAGALTSINTEGLAQFPFSQLWCASSDDAGRTWHNSMVLDVPSAFARPGTLGHLLPATAVDRGGRWYVVVSVQLGSGLRTHLYLLHSSRPSGWSRPARVEHAGSSNVSAAIAAGRPGEVYISWYASRAASFADGTARWREAVAISRDALRADPRFTMRRIGPPVHVGAIEQAGAIGFDIGEDWTLRDFQSIVLDSCGRPHAFWASDYRRNDRVYTAARRGRCSHT